MNWINTHGRHGHWTTIIHGVTLRINYVPADLSGQGKKYRVRTNYNNEMFRHQFYCTLKEAQEAAITMLTEHLKQRENQGLKVAWDETR